MSEKEPLDLLTALCHVDQTLSQTDSGHKSSGTWEVNASSGSEALILFVNIKLSKKQCQVVRCNLPHSE